MNRRLLVLAAVLVLVSIVWLLQFDLKGISLRVFHWAQELGPFGPLLFILAYAVLIVLLLPSTLLTLGAGLLYGVTMGSVYVVAGISLGSLLAFLIGRHWFGERFSRYILMHPKLRAVDSELVHEGFKVILLSRLTPFFPGKLSNYLFGVARFGLRDFFFATTLGVIPFTVLNVYVGKLAGNLAALDPGAVARSPLAWTALAIGVLAGGILIYTMAHLVRHALHSSLANR